MEIVFRDVNGSVVLLIESGSLLAEKDRGKGLGSKYAKDDTSTAKNEEDPVNPSPLTGFFSDPSIIHQHVELQILILFVVSPAKQRPKTRSHTTHD